jgi:hypothetical protein
VHISKPAFAVLLVLAVVGAFTIYEAAKPYVLAYFGRDDGRGYDAQDGSSRWGFKKQRGPDWNNPEVGGWRDRK